MMATMPMPAQIQTLSIKKSVAPPHISLLYKGIFLETCSDPFSPAC